jgi:hypothetical protein
MDGYTPNSGPIDSRAYLSMGAGSGSGPGPTAGVCATGISRPPKALAVHPAPPKAPPPRKAANAAQCQQLEQLPNIGPSIAGDLRSLGITSPQSLAGRDAFVLYQQLCTNTGKRHDPCVLDTFMAAVDFMGGAEPRPWWTYTALRKAMYGVV